MIQRIIASVSLPLTLALACAAVVGCGKSEPAGAATAVSQSATNVALVGAEKPQSPVWKFHWIGKKHLGHDGNATNFLTLWNLPESTKLETQTLDKLATAPWRLLPAATPLSNAPVALLRPLLDDLLQEGFYLEARGAAPRPDELVFAIRLDESHAALWQTNLAVVLESLTGLKTVATGNGWSLRKHDAPDYWRLTRNQDWTLLAASTGEANALLTEVLARLQQDHLPFAAPATNTWLEANLPPALLGRAFPVAATNRDVPTLHVVVAGEAGGVRLRGEATFARALPPALAEAWQIPTNLIHDPLGAFTAVRGLEGVSWPHPLLSLVADSVPNQFFSWAIAYSPFETFFAFPAPDASNRVTRFSELALATGNAFLKTNGTNLERMTNANGLVWRNLPFLQPWLQAADTLAGSFVAGGYVPSMRTNRPAPPELLAQLRANTNLVYYDWEFTGSRIDAWIYLGQTLRLSFNKSQLPPDSAAGQWIQVLIPKLGNTATAVSRLSDRQLTFTRNSDLGLTGLEVHLLADWLEAPNFPAGWHTLDVSPPAPIRVRSR